jgi:thiamine pyrophosphokinase
VVKIENAQLQQALWGQGGGRATHLIASIMSLSRMQPMGFMLSSTTHTRCVDMATARIITMATLSSGRTQIGGRSWEKAVTTIHERPNHSTKDTCQDLAKLVKGA